MQVVIFKIENSVALMIPTQDILETRTAHEVAVKDVPYSVPFKILEQSELPATPQEEWDFPDGYFNSGVGGESNEFNN